MSIFQGTLMFKLINIVIIFFLFPLTQTSCLATKAQMGAMGGAGVGALIGQAIGRDTKSTLIGAALGGTLGYIVGNEMDKYDREQLRNVFETSVSGQSVAWVNPNSRKEFRVTPEPAFQGPNNQPCRKAEVEMIRNRSTESITGCRNNVGNWVIQG
jgi:surface antigen